MPLVTTLDDTKIPDVYEARYGGYWAIYEKAEANYQPPEPPPVDAAPPASGAFDKATSGAAKAALNRNVKYHDKNKVQSVTK